MAFANQFTLSVELTNLIPIALGVAGKTVTEVINFARDLQNSGSDIIVEEDLANLLERSRIVKNVESSFRTVMTQPSQLIPWHGKIALHVGIGPTVIRALTEPHYFSTIVQCSFLTFVHDRTQLAAMINRHFNKAAEDAPASSRRAPPSTDIIEGMLRACEDQTAAYSWLGHLRSVVAVLGLEQKCMHETIPPTVLTGLLLMLPMLQRFPEEHFVHLKTTQGVCSIVVWAHILLGLSVAVRLTDGNRSRFTRVVMFPPDTADGKEQLLVEIDDPDDVETSIVLFKATNKTELFSLKTDSTDDFIEPFPRSTLKGYAYRMLEAAVPFCAHREVVLQEYSLVVGAMAATFIACFGNASSSYFSDYSRPISLTRRFILTWQLLFNDDSFGRMQTIERLVNEYHMAISNGQDSVMPLRWFKQRCLVIAQEVQPQASPAMIQLENGLELASCIVVAITTLDDPHACAETLLCESNGLLRETELHRIMASSLTWPQQSLVLPEICFDFLAQSFVGMSGTQSMLACAAVLSRRGWSLTAAAFGSTSPHVHGSISIRRGIPWNNGNWHHSVLDQRYADIGFKLEHATFGPEDPIQLLDHRSVHFGETLLGERDSALLVALRLISSMPVKAKIGTARRQVRRTGYRQMWTALCRARKTEPCVHTTRHAEVITPSRHWHSVIAFQHHCVGRRSSGGPFACFTAPDAAARWEALLALSTANHEQVPIMLKSADCCFECSLEQTSDANLEMLIL